MSQDAEVLEEQVPDPLGWDAASGGSKSQTREGKQALFTRQMPGGGSVRVEILVSDRGNVAGERLRGRVVMDRGAHPTSADAKELVVEELEGRDADDVLPELLRIARDNAAIARRVMKQQQTADR